MSIKISERPVATTAHIIVDENGRPQLHTLRSSPSKAWAALFGCAISARERLFWKKRGLRVEYVFVKSFHHG